MVIGAAAWLLVAAAPAAASPAGFYQARQIEVAAALELKPDGRFRYALTYGAVDEVAEGDWTWDGETVRLTSNPMPRAPAFELVRDDPAPKGELYMTIEDPGSTWGGALDALATFEGTRDKVVISTDETGRVDLGGRPRLVAVEPLVPVFGHAGGSFALAPDRGHRLTLRFNRNDLGTARFDGEPLATTGDGLGLTRYRTLIRFLPVRP